MSGGRVIISQNNGTVIVNDKQEWRAWIQYNGPWAKDLEKLR